MKHRLISLVLALAVACSSLPGPALALDAAPAQPSASSTAATGDSTPTTGTPEGTNPEGTTPEGTTPEGTDPEGTDPEGTTPEGTTPEGTTPESTPESAPAETTPTPPAANGPLMAPMSEGSHLFGRGRQSSDLYGHVHRDDQQRADPVQRLVSGP